MPAWIAAVWDTVRGGIWFVPAVAILAAITCAVVMPLIDEAVGVADLPSLSWLEMNADGARSTLTSITGALISMATVVFSVSMVTLSLTTSQFGSRLLRTFLNSNATQITLGVFLGASAYSLLLLQSIISQQDQSFVPHLSVGLAVCGTVAALGVFVYFMHHVATSIQAQAVVRAVAADLNDAIEVLFPEEVGERGAEESETSTTASTLHDVEWSSVTAGTEGYLQAVDGGVLMDAAVERNIAIRLCYRPGEFVVRDTPLAEFTPASDDEALAERVRSAFVTGSRRTPRQDVQCAIDELVEVAVRALSPGINDPFTAVTCIDYLGASLRRLATRKHPESQRFDGDGNLRVVASAVTFSDALDSAFDQIRQYAGGSSLVHLRLLQAMQVVADVVSHPAAIESVQRHANAVLHSAQRNLPEEDDVRRVKARHAAVLQSLTDHKR